MIKHADGRIEGTPEELAAYEAARVQWQRLQPITPLSYPTPIGEPCESCRNGGVCGCTLSSPRVIS